MVGFEEYLQARGGELARLARALAGAEQPALELIHSALAEAGRGWARLAGDDPHPLVRHWLVREYLSPWRRADPVASGDPLARLTRRQRAVLVLQLLGGLSFVEIAEHIGGSPSAAGRLWESATAIITEPEAVAALGVYGSASPGIAVLAQGAAVVARSARRRRLAVAASIGAVIVVAVAAVAVFR